MSTRRILGGSAIATGLALILAGGVGAQQQPPRPPQQPPAQQQAPKPWKDAIIGSWTLLIIDGVKADGTHVPLYGPNPKGVAMYGADGRYSQQVMRDVRPKFAANDRLKGTPAEQKAAVEGLNTHFGSYTVDEPGKVLTMRIEGSSFPNWNGTEQKRPFTLAGDDLKWVTPAASGGGSAEVVWKRAK